MLEMKTFVWAIHQLSGSFEILALFTSLIRCYEGVDVQLHRPIAC